MVALHWHPAALDAAAESPSLAERTSLIAGFVVTPEPGLAAGAAWLIFRGLSFHVSHAWMLVKQAKPGLLNTTPDGDVDPFRHGWTRTITTGFGYKF